MILVEKKMHNLKLISLILLVVLVTMFGCATMDVDDPITQVLSSEVVIDTPGDGRYPHMNTFILAESGDGDPVTKDQLRELGYMEIESCSCYPRLTLWSFPSTVDPSNRVASTSSRAGAQEGGSFFPNIRIYPEPRYENILRPNYPKEVEINNVQEIPGSLIQLPPSLSTDKNLVVAILDSPIDQNQLGNKTYIWDRDVSGLRAERGASENCDLSDDPQSNTPTSFQHGTRVAAALIGTYHSVMDTVRREDQVSLKILDLPIFDHRGYGTLFDLICACRKAIAQGVDCINLSCGVRDIEFETQSDRMAAKEELSYLIAIAEEAGIPIVVAAGNYNEDITLEGSKFYPASLAEDYTNLIVVEGNNADGSRWDYSNYGSIVQYGASAQLSSYTGVVAEGTSFATPRIAFWIAYHRRLNDDAGFNAFLRHDSRNYTRPLTNDENDLTLFPGLIRNNLNAN